MNEITYRLENLGCVVSVQMSERATRIKPIRSAHPTEFCPAHCCNKKIVKAMMNRLRLPFPRNASFKPSPCRASRSSCMAASISAISRIIAGESIASLRKKARLAKASSLRSTDASHRGDSYCAFHQSCEMNATKRGRRALTVNRPMHMIPAGTNWKPKGIFQICSPVLMWRLMPTMYMLRELLADMHAHKTRITHS